MRNYHLHLLIGFLEGNDDENSNVELVVYGVLTR